MMGWVFANLKSRTCKTTVCHPNLRRILRRATASGAIIASSNLRGSRLAASGLRSRRPQLGWRCIQEKPAFDALRNLFNARRAIAAGAWSGIAKTELTLISHKT